MTETLTRRNFLKVGGAALAVAAFSARAGASPHKSKIRKAIAYGSIGYEGTVLEKLKAIKAAGFDGVELMSHMFVPDVRSALEETKLDAVGVYCLSDADENTSRGPVEPIMTRLFQALKDAGQYGGVPVRLALGGVTKDLTYEARLKESVKMIDWILPMARAQDAKIAIEIGGSGFITKPDQARAFSKAVNSPDVGWHFNPSASAQFGTPDTWISVLGKSLVNLQITESSKAKGAAVRLSEGVTDWSAVMRALGQVSFKGCAICEQPTSQSADAKALKDLVQRMDRVLSA